MPTDTLHTPIIVGCRSKYNIKKKGTLYTIAYRHLIWKCHSNAHRYLVPRTLALYILNYSLQGFYFVTWKWLSPIFLPIYYVLTQCLIQVRASTLSPRELMIHSMMFVIPCCTLRNKLLLFNKDCVNKCFQALNNFTRSICQFNKPIYWCTII